MAEPVIDLTAVDECKIYVEGNPTALPRPALWKDRLVNSAKGKQAIFTRRITEQVPEPLFVSGESLEVTIWFFMKRPNDDFISRVRARWRLKPKVEKKRWLPLKPQA